MDTNTSPPQPPSGTVDISDDNNCSRWAEYFGVTPVQIEEAVKAAGTDPKAVQEHLLNQGSSAGAS
ncbi:DUF3606 domain-containing protein [Azohydromonas aeria]|uniref:DUF3606 domain-containing protein n=1 Tax=Azohydromonas aeria TaxID=2590212 RepID=UPI0018E05080|nr:DUF3606 domain-containing protein [Azohydromonas aeria]